MQLEMLQEELKQWGELIITTGSGDTFEIHLGDNLKFDTQQNVLHLTTSDAVYIIDGNSIEEVKKHYGHKVK